MDHADVKAFGEALGLFRTRAGLTQQGLADKLGMSRRSVAAWEAGDNLPKTKGVVLQIADIFGLNDEDTHAPSQDRRHGPCPQSLQYSLSSQSLLHRSKNIKQTRRLL